MGGGRWVVDDGRWTVDGGRWTVDGGRWTVDGGWWTVDGGPTEVGSSGRLADGAAVALRFWVAAAGHGVYCARLHAVLTPVTDQS